MALIVEDGSGVTDADSYVTLAYADAYILAMGYTTPDWSALTDAQKESCILRAMSFIEALNYKGTKADQDYSLEWPRVGVIDRNGYALDNDFIPEQLKKALVECAFREQTLGTLQGDLDGASNIKSLKAGSLALEYFEGRIENDPVFQIIDGLLKGLVDDWTTVVRT